MAGKIQGAAVFNRRLRIGALENAVPCWKQRMHRLCAHESKRDKTKMMPQLHISGEQVEDSLICGIRSDPRHR